VLPAAARLRRRADFTATVRGGVRSAAPAVVIHLRVPSSGPADPASADPARAGFVVSRAVGSAVVRNRVRRRLRHLARPRLADLPGGSALVVRATPAAAAASGAELERQFDSGLQAALVRASR
jgi:ribonuclease P protein component